MKLFLVLICLLSFGTFCMYAKAGEMAAFAFILSLLAIMVISTESDARKARRKQVN